MNRNVIEQLKKAAAEIKPDEKWLARARESLEIQAMAHSQTKYTPSSLGVNAWWKQAALVLFGTAGLAAACFLLILSPLPGMSEVRQSAHKIVPALFNTPKEATETLETHKKNLNGALLLESKLENSDIKVTGASVKSDNKEIENSAITKPDSASATPRATKTYSTTSSSSIPGMTKKPTIIETLKRIIHLPETPDKEKPEQAADPEEVKNTKGKDPEETAEQGEQKKDNRNKS